MIRRSLPSQAYLKECFTYNPYTGDLSWRLRPLKHFDNERGWAVFNSLFPGTLLGKCKISICGIYYFKNRVIFKFVTGEEPWKVDHRDHDVDNNRINNLRAATNSQNQQNQKVRCDSLSGYKGITQIRSGRWRARIAIDNSRPFLGTFKTKEEAYAAYCEAAQKHYGEFWCSG